MGHNTVVVLHNDFTRDWPKEMLEKMQMLGHDSTGGRFGYGQVACQTHADDLMIVAVERYTGKRLTAHSEIDEKHLQAMSDILRAHGYAVRAPGAKRAEGPTDWGYAAKQARKADAEATS